MSETKHTFGSALSAVLGMVVFTAHAGQKTAEAVEVTADSAKDLALAGKSKSRVTLLECQVDEAIALTDLGKKILQVKEENKGNKALMNQLDSLL